jgi:hypothetical protein
MLTSPAEESILEQPADLSRWQAGLRPFLLYLILVGLPILGILGLLRAGQNLSAPISVAGTWETQLSFPASPSDDLTIQPGPIVLHISQSGTHLFLAFDEKTKLVGSIDDMTISAALSDGPGSTNTLSLSPTAIYFRGRINRGKQSDQLLGVITFAQGTVRTEVLLTASRQRAAIKPAGGY